MRISVIVTPEEHAKIKRAAGLVPLSAWMKTLALNEARLNTAWEPAWLKANKGKNNLQPLKAKK
jgi:hypothetical protein